MRQNPYYEPFFGGGALFFSLQPQRAVLSDWNPELINCYEQVKMRPAEVIAHLKLLKNSKENYYAVRQEVPDDVVKQAARLIYLTTLSFNGIYRMNASGKFNVPYGQRPTVNPCREELINATSKALSSAHLRDGDFEKIVEKAQKGDLVYLDPPYTVAHGNNGFLLYNENIFSWDDQERLSKIAKKLARRGCKVIISNADHESITNLYQDFEMCRIERASVIGVPESRRRITECIFYSKEHK